MGGTGAYAAGDAGAAGGVAAAETASPDSPFKTAPTSSMVSWGTLYAERIPVTASICSPVRTAAWAGAGIAQSASAQAIATAKSLAWRLRGRACKTLAFIIDGMVLKLLIKRTGAGRQTSGNGRP